MRYIKMIPGIFSAALLAGVCISAGAQAPDSITFSEDAQMITKIGETWDASGALEISGGDADTKISYSSYDESVAEVSEDGIVTGTGCGVTTIVAASEEDDTISDSIDVAVLELDGTYADTKHIDAMGCDITVKITLNEDGTFAFYRAPMTVQLEGGGEMPEMTDEGTYETDGAEIAFHAEELGDFTASVSVSDGTAVLKGTIPTGGAPTELELEKQTEEMSESETGEQEDNGEPEDDKETEDNNETEDGTE